MDKGCCQFDSLRQACIDPEGRSFVGPRPPLGANPSQTIVEVSINGTTWCDTPKLYLNHGLVTIIGVRGSGKTALAEIIAAGCDAVTDGNDDGEMSKSFLNRAKPELVGLSVTLNWGSGRASEIRSLYNVNLSRTKLYNHFNLSLMTVSSMKYTCWAKQKKQKSTPFLHAYH